MLCPVCSDEKLVMTDRQGVEIDYCAKCRGVWLDRGELDKIIERSSAVAPSQFSSTSQPAARDMSRHSGEYSERKHHDDRHYKKKKPGGFLGELFDF
ncbi:MAG: zf-TFIIB domain-containing protein [Pseudomonadota bacterium]